MNDALPVNPSNMYAEIFASPACPVAQFVSHSGADKREQVAG
jgi:hypothetical protein